MTKTRLEAFSDGVFAIIVTIMVLELKVPHETDLHALKEMLPLFLSYLSSFIFIGIYWGNHHHLLHTVHHVNSKIIWANMSLLFWLSLVPFATGWIGENPMAEVPVAVYATLFLLCGIAFFILQKVIENHYTHSTKLIEALKKTSKKGILSLLLYSTAVVFAFINPTISYALIVVVAILWVIPDKNIERAIMD
jgi:uncharacterized membrane protein